MKQLKVRNILECDFRIFGRYANLLELDTPCIGAAPIRFYRDMMPLSGNQALSVSVTLVDPMPKIVDILEYHSYTGECFITLDGDTVICLAPACPGSKPEIKDIQAFYVPRGTAVYIHPGVWHYAPYPVGNDAIHSMVLLPERTYANDCCKYEFAAEEMMEILL